MIYFPSHLYLWSGIVVEKSVENQLQSYMNGGGSRWWISSMNLFFSGLNISLNRLDKVMKRVKWAKNRFTEFVWHEYYMFTFTKQVKTYIIIINVKFSNVFCHVLFSFLAMVIVTLTPAEWWNNFNEVFLFGSFHCCSTFKLASSCSHGTNDVLKWKRFDFVL